MTQARTFSLGGSSRTGLLLAAILAAITGVLVFALLRSNDDGGDPVRNITGGGETTVVTAKQDISARTEIKEDMLELSKVPSSALLQGAQSDRQLVVGRIARQDIHKGEQLVSGDLATEKQDLGLPFLIPAGMRGIAVEVDKVIGAGGLLRPGDRVDIVVVMDVKYEDINTSRSFEQTQAFTLTQNIEVLAVEQKLLIAVRTGDDNENSGTSTDQPEADPEAQVVTLSLLPLEAQNLLLADEKGVIRLAVRPPGDTEVVDLPNSSFINLADPEFAQLLQDALRQPAR